MLLKFVNNLKKNDWVLFVSSLALVFMGLISIYSTTSYDSNSFFIKQIVWLMLGIAIFFLFSSFDYRIFKIHFFPVLFLYFLGLVALFLVYIVGYATRGAQSWISLGLINIQPVEILKIILILILAKYFLSRHIEMYKIKHIFISGLYVLLPSILILLQPDIGSFLVLISIWIGIMIISGIKLKHLLVLFLLGALLSTLAWSFLLLDYQKARISTFLNPTLDPYGAGYNAIQSLVALGSGGFWGKGLGAGTQSQLGFLPERHTDFIFASITEELGVAAAFIILVLYGIIFFRIAQIIRSAPDNFARLTAIGIGIMIIVQTILNIGMTLNLLPITGLTLPFVSYGGSSLLALFLAIGILNSIYRNSTESVSIGTRDLSAEVASLEI